MELKVKALDGVEEKSVQEVEQELLDKAEDKSHEETQVEEKTESQVKVEVETLEPSAPAQSSELNEEDVLSYIKKRYDKQIDSVEQLFETKQENKELPQDVAAYLDYKEKTGRGINDYVKLNRDFNSMNEESLLKEYYLATEQALDEEDLDIFLSEFDFDAEVDEEKEVKKIKLAKKKAIAKAKKFFNEQKEMYKQPLESRTVGVSKEDKEALEAYQQYVKKSKTYEEETNKKRDWFLTKTKEVFNDFKGFDFKINEDKVVSYKPTNVEELKESNSDVNKFFTKFMNKEGLLEDAKGFHKALTIAQNPERFAKFFYEQGLSDATEDVTRKIKNVNMSDRKTPEIAKKDGVQIRALNQSSGRGLRIKSKK
tara:strand:+ start:223 stop:1329 length:1107 start_codon:yes stop_codon:yes gene_type:complete